MAPDTIATVEYAYDVLSILNGTHLMAHHFAFSLPALKLTKHNKSGCKAVSYLPRTTLKKSAPIQLSQKEDQLAASEEDGPSLQGFLDVNLPRTGTTFLEDPTSYELEKKASVVGWKQIRKEMLIAVVEGSGMFCHTTTMSF